jgi:hypothetical protein
VSENAVAGAAPAQTMLAPFPRPGRRIEHAYTELDLAAGTGTLQQQNALGDPRLLARPWDPTTCVNSDLRAEVWQWLEQFVGWLNREYVWDAEAMVPPCWPHHPHLVHELAVLADLRRRAGQALTGDALEEWHRYALPAFTDRMRQRLRQHCQDGGHQPWPAVGRHTRHLGDGARRDRTSAYRADIETLNEPPGVAQPSIGSRRPNLQIVDGLRVDLDSGEVLD